MFDPSIELELTGTVREFRWSNPHAWIELEVPGEDAEATVWAIEMNAPSMLQRLGWGRSSLARGDHVTIVVNPLRDGGPGGTIVRAQLADGAVLEGRNR